MMPRHSINISEFRQLLESDLDESDFIVLSTGFLQHISQQLSAYNEPDKHAENSSQHIEANLADIRQAYLESNYEHALLVIHKTLITIRDDINRLYSEKFPDDDLNFIQFILEKLAKVKIIDIRGNHTKRFFETKMAQLYHEDKNIQEQHIASTNTIYKKMLKTTIASPEDTDLHKYIFLNDWRLNTISNRTHFLKELTSLYASKDKVKKIPDSDADETIFYSRNPAVLTSVSPNFYDEISDSDLTDHISDLHRISGRDDGFSLSNRRYPFVGSVSGHIYTYIAIFELYMAEKPDDIHLQRDINNAIQLLIWLFIKHGWHSYGELTSVFTQYEINARFNANNVSLDFSMPNNILENAFNMTQQYAKVNCLKRRMHLDLIHQTFLSPFKACIDQKHYGKALMILRNLPYRQLTPFLKSANLNQKKGMQLARSAEKESYYDAMLALANVDPGRKLVPAKKLLMARGLIEDEDLRQLIIDEPTFSIDFIEMSIKVTELYPSINIHLFNDRDIRQAILDQPTKADIIVKACILLIEIDSLDNKNIKLALLSHAEYAPEMARAVTILKNANVDGDTIKKILHSPIHARSLASFFVTLKQLGELALFPAIASGRNVTDKLYIANDLIKLDSIDLLRELIAHDLLVPNHIANILTAISMMKLKGSTMAHKSYNDEILDDLLAKHTAYATVKPPQPSNNYPGMLLFPQPDIDRARVSKERPLAYCRKI